MYCERCLERGKQNPNGLAGGLANEKPRPGCSCILTDEWQLARSQRGGALMQRVVVVSEQQKSRGSSHSHKGRGGFRQR